MIKMIVENSTYRHRQADGKEVYRAELIADTAAELTGVTEVGGNVLDFGSIAHAVDDAVILRFDSTGAWVIQTGDNAGKTPAEVAISKAALSAPKTALTNTTEYSEEIEGDGTGEALPEVEKTAYPDDAEPLERVEKLDIEDTRKVVNADDKSE